MLNFLLTTIGKSPPIIGVTDFFQMRRINANLVFAGMVNDFSLFDRSVMVFVRKAMRKNILASAVCSTSYMKRTVFLPGSASFSSACPNPAGDGSVALFNKREKSFNNSHDPFPFSSLISRRRATLIILNSRFSLRSSLKIFSIWY